MLGGAPQRSGDRGSCCLLRASPRTYRGLGIAVGDFMSTDPDIPHTSAAGLMEHVAAPIDADAAAQALKHGARGAFVVPGISAGLLFIGWLAFYFLLFLPRGSVG